MIADDVTAIAFYTFRKRFESPTEAEGMLCLIETDNNRNIMVIDCLHRRGTHLLALAATRRGLFGSRLAIMLPETRIHIALNIDSVLQNVVNDSFLECPPEEIQLTHGGLFDRWLSADLKRDAFAAAERIKETLAVCLEFALVLEMYNKLLIVEEIADIEFLGVVRDEPFNNTETDRCRASQKRRDLLNASRLVVEILEPTDDKVLLTLNAIFGCRTCCVHPCWHRYSIGFRWTQ